MPWGLQVRFNLQNMPRIFHEEVEQKDNKQMLMEEYPIEYSASEHRLIYM